MFYIFCIKNKSKIIDPLIFSIISATSTIYAKDCKNKIEENKFLKENQQRLKEEQEELKIINEKLSKETLFHDVSLKIDSTPIIEPESSSVIIKPQNIEISTLQYQKKKQEIFEKHKDEELKKREEKRRKYQKTQIEKECESTQFQSKKTPLNQKIKPTSSIKKNIPQDIFNNINNINNTKQVIKKNTTDKPLTADQSRIEVKFTPLLTNIITKAAYQQNIKNALSTIGIFST